MKKNKKILIIVISIILVLAVILGIIFLVSKNKQGNTNEIQEAQKTEKVYEEVSKANQITFTCTLDDKHKETTTVITNLNIFFHNVSSLDILCITYNRLL